MTMNPSDFRVPTPIGGPNAKKQLRKRTDEIRQEWLERLARFKRNAASSFSEHPDDWMVRQIYELVRFTNSKLLSAALELDRERHRRLSNIEDQPFKQGLILVAGWHPLLAAEQLLSRQRRMELGDAMQYAHQHDVPARYVNGFIKQAGLKRIRAKLASGYIEPGFEFD